MKLTDAKFVQALTNLRDSPDFRVFMEALKEDEREEANRSLKLEGAQCHRAQGAALKLQEIAKCYADAPETLVKLQPKG